MKTLTYILLIVALSFLSKFSFSQDIAFNPYAYPENSFNPSTESKNTTKKQWWFPTALSGKIRFKSALQKRNFETEKYTTQENNRYFSGGINLDTKSYIWHPNFLIINVGGAYDISGSKYDYYDDYISDNTLLSQPKSLNIQTTLFNQRPVSLTSKFNLSQTHGRRDYLTEILTRNQVWGNNLLISTNKFPINIYQTSSRIRQEELLRNRTLIVNQDNFGVKTSTSFLGNDKHQLSYEYEKYDSKLNSYGANNIDNSVQLYSKLPFGEKDRHTYSSSVLFFDRQGTYAFRDFLIREGLYSKLSDKLTFSGDYSFERVGRESGTLNENDISARLNHQLFLSLSTGIFFNTERLKHTSYQRTVNTVGTNIRYSKKLLFKGNLSIGYTYQKRSVTMTSPSSSLEVMREIHTLTDGEITLLDRAYANKETITVTDESGTIIYQSGLDYELTERSNYIEIRRLPGGQIAEGSIVYVHYTATLPGNYAYDEDRQELSANLSLFNRFVEVYYNFSDARFPNVAITNVETLNLKYHTQQIYGIRIDARIITAGVEYDSYISNIIPYESVKYYLGGQTNFKNVLLSLNSSLTNQIMLDDGSERTYANLSARASYRIKFFSISTNIGYLSQKLPDYDLSLLTSANEFTVNIRQLSVKLGVEIYNRIHTREELKINGAYLQLIRKF